MFDFGASSYLDGRGVGEDVQCLLVVNKLPNTITA